MNSQFSSALSRRLLVGMTLLLAISVAIPSVLAQGNSAGNTNRPDRVSQMLLDLHASETGAVTTDAPTSAPASVVVAPDAVEAAAGATIEASAVSTLGEFSLGQTDAIQSLVATYGDYVLIDAVAETDGLALINELNAAGLIGGSQFGRHVSGYLPISAIPMMESAATLGYMTASRAELFEGFVDNEAVFGQQTDVAESLYGLTGEGLTIGILSDSFDCKEPSVIGGAPGPDLNGDGISSYADDILSGDLPAGIIVLEEVVQIPGVPTGCIDEGRAMAQLVHDIIPDAQILFHTAFNGEASFASGIVELALAGSDVIVDDVRYFAEPVYQDGIVAQAVDIVTEMGVPYFSSAGNAADQGYVAPFNPSIPFTDPFTGIEYVLHDFNPDPAVLDFTNFASVAPGGSSTYILQWDDPFATVSTSGAGPDSDLDMLLFSGDLGGYFGAFNAGSDIGGIPFDGFSVGGPFEFNILIGLKVGTNPDVTITTYSSSSSLTQEYDGDPTSWGHANSKGANATGAAFWGTTPFYSGEAPLVNGFSSYGGIPILFDLAGNRIEPDFEQRGVQFTGIDGSNNTFFRFDTGRDEDTNPNFFGTSAGAPNAAAVAVQMLEANPDLTPLEVRAALQETAIDIQGTNDVGGPARNQEISLPVGFDAVSGAGLVQANDAARVVISSPATCNGLDATVYVLDGVIVGGPDDGQPFLGTLSGGDGNDVISGTNVTDTIDGHGGDDVICGFGENDFIRAGKGEDVVFGGEGNDDLRGEKGEDQLFGEGGADALYGAQGDDLLDGGDGVDFCSDNQGDNTLAACE